MAKRSNRKPAPVAPAAAVAEDTRRPWPAWLGVLAIIAATFWVYQPAIGGGWLWDDDWYITNQPLMRNLAGLWKLWFHFGAWVDFYPLSETLLWIEWHLWGYHPLGYHLVNIAVHAGNALLLWRLLAKLGLRHAWLGGMLFAVYPVAVDSVAWVAETKNTVDLLFGLLALGAWLDFTAGRHARDYAWALIFFLLAMLGKISLMTVPVLLLFHIGWSRRRLALDDFVLVAPFFVVALIVCTINQWCFVTYWHHSSEVLDTAPSLSPTARLVLAGQLLAIYLTHFVWPVGLLPIYPQWQVNPADLRQWTPWPVLLLGAFLLWCKRDTWGRPALLGLGCFFILIFPFLGLVTAPYMSFSWVLDHVLYAPMIGLIGLVIAAFGSIEERVGAARQLACTAAATLVVALLAFSARGYAVAFSDEATLWGYTVPHNPGSWLAQDNLGKALLLNDQPEDAAAHLRIADALRPGRAQTHLNLGRALVAEGRVNDGIAEYDTALALKPDDPEIHNQKGIALMQLGRNADAVAELEQAVQLRPAYAIGLENLGIALALSGHLDEAIERFHASLALNPDDATVHVNLGRALRQLGRAAEADDQFRQALRLDPDNAAVKAAFENPTPSSAAPRP